MLRSHDLPRFNFYDPRNPIYTYINNMPAAKVKNSNIDHALIARGSIINAASIAHSIIGLRSIIDEGSVLRDTIVMGVDEDVFEKSYKDARYFSVSLGIGKNCEISQAIIDKNARIGDNVIIRPFPEGTEFDDPDPIKKYYIRDGIVIVPKNTTIPDGTVIAP